MKAWVGKDCENTFARNDEPGRPFSRAKAHIIREPVARTPMLAKMTAAMIMRD